MSGEFHGETETILDGLDTVGNTTKAVTKGFAIGSAVIAAVALFASFRETIAAELGATFNQISINIADPKTFAGALVGGTVVFLFSSLAILAVGRTAGNGRPGGPPAVPGEARDHGLHREARLRPGHRHLHRAPRCAS